MRIFPDPEPVTQVCAIRARNSVPDAGLSDVLTPGRQGVFLRLCSSIAGASRTASLAFCSSESGGAKWASLRRYSSCRCLYLSSRCCPASVISRLAIRSLAPGRSRPAGSSTKKQTRIPRLRCTSRRTGAARRSAAVQAARERRHPSACALGDPPWSRLRAGPGLTAQFRRLAGQRLVQLALGRAPRDPAHLGPQVSPATGELAQRSHRGGLFIRRGRGSPSINRKWATVRLGGRSRLAAGVSTRDQMPPTLCGHRRC